MELGQGNEGRILSGINHGEVVVGLGISRLDLDRFAQCRLGGFALAKVVECRSEEMLGALESSGFSLTALAK